MKKYLTSGIVMLAVAMLALPTVGFAATSPDLGGADTYSILSGTYTNTAPGTTLNGDLGFTTPPAVTPTVNGATNQANAAYNQAGIDQASALSDMNSQPCSFTFANGAIDLASDTTHGPAGVYAPGVYCISGAASIGGGGTITLTGTGTYIFRMTDALNTSANSIVAVAGGASACNVFWTPGAATTLGASSTFMGTVIDAAGISIGNLVNWTGRALAFGGTVSTDANTINTSTCANSTDSPGTGTPTSTDTPGSSSANPNTPGLPQTGLGEPGLNPIIIALFVLSLAIGIRVYHKLRHRA